MTPLPLHDFLVIDLTAHRAGPTAVRQLADWGAQAIKIEPSGRAGRRDRQPPRRSRFSEPAPQQAGYDVEPEERRGREIFFKLAERADVIVENYKSDVKHRLGIDYEAVRKINPRIVYGSISGFGQDGPYAGRAGVDQIAQGMGGPCRSPAIPGKARCGSASRSTTSRPACCCPTGLCWRCSTASAPAKANGFTPRFSRRRFSCWTSRQRAT